MLSKNQLGFLYMLLSVCAFSVMDLIVKWSDSYPLGQVIFFRGFFGLVLYYFVIPKERLKDFYYTNRPILHFSRCFFGLIALLSIFIALRNLPLATVVSITFAVPIFTTIFSILFLSEKVGFFRWLAVIVGFIGIVVISEPGLSALNIYYIFPFIFVLGLSYVAISIRQLSSTNVMFQKGIAAAEDIFKQIDEIPEKDDGSKIIKNSEGKIKFDNVSLKYPSSEEYSLKNINFELEKGSNLAIVGSSGAGKSSIINLIPRFYDSIDGDITIDGQSIYDIKIQSLRNNISLVSQDITLFDDTVISNIAYANLDASENEIIEAAKLSYCDEFIKDCLLYTSPSPRDRG